MIQVLAVAGLAISLLSFTGGAVITHKWYRVAQLRADNATMRLNLQRFKAQLNFSEAIDEATQAVEISDAEILLALAAKTSTPTLPGNPIVCVDGDSMRDIGKLGQER